jgi:chromate transporter
VALLSFGGPAGQIAVMHRIPVEEKHWIGETRFQHALNYGMPRRSAVAPRSNKRAF